LVITHTIAPVNLHSSPKVRQSLCTQRKQRLPSVTFPIELDVTLGHAHFRGKLFVRLFGIPHTKPPTKSEVSSSSSFGAIDAAMVDMTLNDLKTKVKGQGYSFWYQSISHIRLPICCQ